MVSSDEEEQYPPGFRRYFGNGADGPGGLRSSEDRGSSTEQSSKCGCASNFQVLRRLWFLLIIAFFTAVAFSSAQATLSEMLLAQECDYRDIRAEDCANSKPAHKTAATKFAAAAAIIAGSNLLTTNLLGQIAQRVGRKPALILPILGMAGSYLVLSLFHVSASHFWLILTLIAVCSLAGGIFSVLAALFTITADVTASLSPANPRDSIHSNSAAHGTVVSQARAEKTLTAAYGFIEGVVWLGFVAGPSVGHQIAAHWSFRATFLTAGALEVLLAIVAAFGLKETITPVQRVGGIRWRQAHPLSGIFLLTSTSPYTRRLGIVVLFALIGALGAISVIPLFVKKEFDMPTAQVGYVQSLSFASGAIGLLYVLPALRLWGVNGKSIILLGLTITASALGAFAFLTESWQAYIVAGSLMFSGVLFPVARALLSRSLGATARPTVLAAYGSLEVLAAVVSPLLFPTLYSATETMTMPRSLPQIAPGLVFIAGAVMLMLALIVAMTLPKVPPDHVLYFDLMNPGAIRVNSPELSSGPITEVFNTHDPLPWEEAHLSSHNASLLRQQANATRSIRTRSLEPEY